MGRELQSRLASIVSGLRKEARGSNSLQVLRAHKADNAFVSFSSMAKIGINPVAEDNFNPKGFYGIPLTDAFLLQLEQEAYTHALPYHPFHGRKYLVVFRPITGVHLLQLSSRDQWESFKEVQGLSNANGSQLTLAMIKLGYDGVLSSNRAMSGDFKDEIVLFPPFSRTVDVIGMTTNKLQDEFLVEKLENDIRTSPKADRPRLQKTLESLKLRLRGRKLP